MKDIEIITTTLTCVSILLSFLYYRVTRKATKDSNRFQKLSVKFQEMSLQYQTLALQYQELASQKNHFEMSKHHQQTLNEVTDEFSIVMKRLMSAASKAHNKIYNHFKVHGPITNGKGLHGSFLAINRLVKDLFDKQLDKQPGQYLIDQLGILTGLENDFEDYEEPNSLWQKMKRFFVSNPEPTTTRELLCSNPLFCQNVNNLLKFFTEEQSRQLYSEVYPFINEYFEAHNEVEKKLYDLEKRLTKAQEENQREPFDIERIPNFGEAFKRTKADIIRMNHLCPKYIPTPGGSPPPFNCIANIIFAGTVLHIVSHPHLWGQSLPNWSLAWRPYTHN
ncbi:MAG: hypothetical protein JEY79_17045 [Pseudodesulfovibrio sp.]|nr:hypothetical protein [Pseudodesulfovibrio sp.]